METILARDLAIRCALPAEQNDRILPVVLCIHVLSNSTRRQADIGVESISARSFLDRRRNVMNRIPIRFNSLSLA